MMGRAGEIETTIKKTTRDVNESKESLVVLISENQKRQEKEVKSFHVESTSWETTNQIR